MGHSIMPVSGPPWIWPSRRYTGHKTHKGAVILKPQKGMSIGNNTSQPTGHIQQAGTGKGHIVAGIGKGHIVSGAGRGYIVSGAVWGYIVSVAGRGYIVTDKQMASRTGAYKGPPLFCFDKFVLQVMWGQRSYHRPPPLEFLKECWVISKDVRRLKRCYRGPPLNLWLPGGSRMTLAGDG